MGTARSVGICMSIPWLAFTGFTVTFSALFSKTWRVNKFFNSASAFGKMEVSEKDVLAPFAVLLTCNFIVLISWTVIDPLTYERQFEDGTDYWNREIASNGSCRSDHAAAYLAPLALSKFPQLSTVVPYRPTRITHPLASLAYKVNFSILCTACWQAFQSRDIKSEFSEAVYIGLAVFSMSQAFLTGIPIVTVVRDIPEAFYMVLTFLLFFLCMVILLLIFLPKFFMQRVYASMSQADQRKMMATSVRQSALHSSSILRQQDEAPSGSATISSKEGASRSRASRAHAALPEDVSQPLGNVQEAEVKEGEDEKASPFSSYATMSNQDDELTTRSINE
jgi:hypothetical protein